MLTKNWRIDTLTLLQVQFAPTRNDIKLSIIYVPRVRLRTNMCKRCKCLQLHLSSKNYFTCKRHRRRRTALIILLLFTALSTTLLFILQQREVCVCVTDTQWIRLLLSFSLFFCVFLDQPLPKLFIIVKHWI